MKRVLMFAKKRYGLQLVTNGGFDTDTDWIKGDGWTISGGSANCVGSDAGITQNTILTIGVTYVIDIEFNNLSGTVVFSGSSFDGDLTDRQITQGKNRYILTANGANFQIYAVAGSTISIDNVSVREVL